MFNRRSVMVGGLAMAAAQSLIRVAQAQSGKPMLVFVGHELCGGCRIWRAQSEPGFKKSDAFGKLDYQVVYPANADLVTAEASWPAATRPVRTAFLDSEGGKSGGSKTPRFILFQDGTVVLTVTGNAGWKDKMWPKLVEVTGTKA